MGTDSCVLELGIKYTAYYHNSLEKAKTEQEGEACERVLATPLPVLQEIACLGST